MNGSSFETLGLVFAELGFQDSEVGQQPVENRLACCGNRCGLFESRTCGSHFINKLLKTDCQRSANLLQSLLRVSSGLFTFCVMLSAT
ncbi:hypothetical protein EGH82_18900 [Vibrio ponticus]|uniref:Uncharacterized protein n=1 Tax=Vibrio ponticus TaxID=265668 RepID=A0A3N3DVX7_9VIBR|nr:hypothetical protein EGH82_18900 [Vibrio ponticus]